MSTHQHSTTRTTAIRFDLTMVFSVTTLWAVLLAIMHLLDFPGRGYLIVSLLLVMIATAQWLFRRAGHPMLIAIVAGTTLAIVGEMILRVSQSLPVKLEMGLILNGAAIGCFAHACIRATLLFAAFVRFASRPRRDR